MAERRQESFTSDGTASRINKKAIIDLSLSEASSDEEDDVSVDSETEEEIILEKHKVIDNIDNNNNIIDGKISEAPETSHQTVENSRKRLANTSRAGLKKRKKPTGKYIRINWQKEPPTGRIKRRLFIGVSGISATTENRINIFEIMITDELPEIIVERTNLYFQQSLVEKVFKNHHPSPYLESKQA